MKTNCLNCGKENPKHGMKTCCRKCADELKKINSREKRKCVYCQKEFEVRKKDERKLCSEDCRKKWQQLPENIEHRINESKKAVKEKFGVDNVFQLKDIKERSKETKKEKYGDENYNNYEKMLNTKKEKYGDNYLKDWYKNTEKTLQKNYNVSHGLQIQKFKDKKTKTTLEKYGVENVSQNEDVKKKRIKTTKERFGVEYASQNEEIKEKIKNTSIKNFGVSHHLKDYEMFQKHLKAQYKIKQYKKTEIFYQGTFELYFLEKMEEKSLLNEVKSGRSFNYVFDNKNHVYHTDFFYNGENIEIKSGWTYDNNGTNELLKRRNDTKWKSVISSGERIRVLFSKKEIAEFVDGIL